jgi:hypothetical protein
MAFKLGYSRESRENRNALRNQVYRLKQDGCDRILADVESAFQNDDRTLFIAQSLESIHGRGLSLFTVNEVWLGNISDASANLHGTRPQPLTSWSIAEKREA